MHGHFTLHLKTVIIVGYILLPILHLTSSWRCLNKRKKSSEPSGVSTHLKMKLVFGEVYQEYIINEEVNNLYRNNKYQVHLIEREEC